MPQGPGMGQVFVPTYLDGLLDSLLERPRWADNEDSKMGRNYDYDCSHHFGGHILLIKVVW